MHDSVHACACTILGALHLTCAQHELASHVDVRSRGRRERGVNVRKGRERGAESAGKCAG